MKKKLLMAQEMTTTSLGHFFLSLIILGPLVVVYRPFLCCVTWWHCVGGHCHLLLLGI